MRTHVRYLVKEFPGITKVSHLIVGRGQPGVWSTMRAARGMEPTEGSQREVWNPIGSCIPQLPLVENYAAVGTLLYTMYRGCV